VFTAIGVTAGLLGRAILLGSWAYYGVAAVCVLLGLQLLDVIDLRFDRLNVGVARRPSAGGIPGVFVLGVLFGVVATPCSTPILAAIATLAAAGRDPIAGGALLFVYGLGKGVPFLLVGVFSGAAPLLLKGARAAVWLRRSGGLALLALAAYLVWLA